MTAPVVAIGALADLQRHRDAALARDANLDAVLAYLRVLSTADEAALVELDVVDPAIRSKMARVELQMALTVLTHYVTTGWNPAVRSAPPSGLAEVVREVARSCVNPSCDESWLPWESSECSPECEAIAETCI